MTTRPDTQPAAMPGTPAGTAPQPTPGGQPAIHDIGYRRYDGPRLGGGAIWRSLVVDGLRGSYGLGRSAGAKVWPWLLLGIATLPTIIVVVVASLTGTSELPVTPAGYVLQVTVLVSVFVAVVAPRVVSRDLRFRTVPLYFSRPMRRTDYVTAKGAAMTAAVAVLTLLPVTVLALGALLAELPWREQLEAWGEGAVVALLVAVLYAAVALAVAAWTPRRGLGTAAVIGVFLVTTAVASVVQGLTVETGREDLTGYAAALAPANTVDGLAAWITGAPSDFGFEVDVGLGLVLLAVWAGTVALCYAILVLRYRRVSAS